REVPEARVTKVHRLARSTFLVANVLVLAVYVRQGERDPEAGRELAAGRGRDHAAGRAHFVFGARELSDGGPARADPQAILVDVLEREVEAEAALTQRVGLRVERAILGAAARRGATVRQRSKRERRKHCGHAQLDLHGRGPPKDTGWLWGSGCVPPRTHSSSE